MTATRNSTYLGQYRERGGKWTTFCSSASRGGAWDMALTDPDVPKRADVRVIEMRTQDTVTEETSFYP